MNPNDPTPDFSDEQVMAFVDGELDDDSARRLRDALPRDPALARRVEAERALCARLTRAFASDLDEPVPDRLRGLLPSGAAATTDSAAPAPVADLAAARASRRTSSPALRWAMAACLVGGVALGWFGRPALDADATGGAAVVAQGALAEALEHQAGDVADGPIRIPVTVRGADGGYCRAFVAPAGAGLACRDDDGWRVRQLTPAPVAEGGALRMAASALPPAVLDAIDAIAASPSLDADAERAAIAANWRR